MKCLGRFVAVALIIALLPMYAFAAQETTDQSNVIYYDDGSYITIDIISIDSRATQTKIGSKVYTYYDSNDNVEWKATLTGTFAYNGYSCTCAVSSYTVDIVDTDWYEISGSTTRSGNSAVLDLTMGRKMLGVTVKKLTIEMTLTCDVSGNLS